MFKKTMMTVLACGLTGWAALPAMAGHPEKDQDEADQKIVVHGEYKVNTMLGGDQGNTTVIREVEGGESFEIRTEDGKIIFVKINGDKVDAQKIKVIGNLVIVQDEHGGVLREVSVPGLLGGQNDTATAFVWTSGDGDEWGFLDQNDKRAVKLTKQTKPAPVMIGITMSEPGAALRYHLGLDKKNPGILLDSVGKGLPAGLAGLKKFDVIVSIEGSHGATQKLLGEVLTHKDPGDEMEVTVARGPDRRHITIHLEAYDGERLGRISSDSKATRRFFTGDDGKGNRDDKRLFDALIQKEIDAQKRFFELRENRLVFPDLNDLRGRVHRAMPLVEQEIGEHLDELEERLEELEDVIEEQLEELEDKFDRLIEWLEEKHEDD